MTSPTLAVVVVDGGAPGDAPGALVLGRWAPSWRPAGPGLPATMWISSEDRVVGIVAGFDQRSKPTEKEYPMAVPTRVTFAP
jgi:hypothetical protein